MSISLRRSFWEWPHVALLIVNLVWTTLCLGGYRPDTMVVSGALTGLLVTVHFAARALEGWRSEASDNGARPAWSRWFGWGGFHPAGWLLVPFLVYAAANVLWVTPVPWLGWRDWLGWLQMIAVFWVVLNGVRSRAARACLLSTLLALGFVAVLLACYQRFVRPDWLMMGRVQVEQFIGRASGPFGIPNSLAALLLLLLPLAGAQAARRGASATQRIVFGYLTVAFAFGLLLTVSRGGWLALMIVLLAWPVLGVRGAWWKRAGLAAVVAILIGLIGATVFSTVPIARQRLVQLVRDAGERSRPILWRGAVQIFQDHRVWGSGAGSYNLALEKHRPEGFQDEPRWAHNEYLNTLSDYGAVGFVLFFGVGGVIIWRCARSSGDRPRRGPKIGEPTPDRSVGSRRERGVLGALDRSVVQQALAAGLAAFGLQLLVDFHFKIPALAMSAAVIAALWVQRRWPETAAATAPRVSTPLLLAAAVAAATGASGFVMPVYRAESLRYEARQSIDRLALDQAPVERWAPVVNAAAGALQKAVAIDPTNGAAWADLSYARALQIWNDRSRGTELAQQAERSADRALACSDFDPEFWVRRGVALDLQGRWVEAGQAFVHALGLAPARALVWYHQAFHLSLDPRQHEQAVAATTLCLRLDGANREAQALRQRLTGRRGGAPDSSSHAPH